MASEEVPHNSTSCTEQSAQTANWLAISLEQSCPSGRVVGCISTEGGRMAVYRFEITEKYQRGGEI